MCAMFLLLCLRGFSNTWSWLRTYQLQAQVRTCKEEGWQEGNDDTHWYESTLVFKIEYEYEYLLLEKSKRKDFSGGIQRRPH